VERPRRLFNDDFDEAERVFEQVLNDSSAPQSMRQRASAYKGLLHAKRGPKPAPAPAAAGGASGGTINVTPVIEPESGGAMPADRPRSMRRRRNKPAPPLFSPRAG